MDADNPGGAIAGTQADLIGADHRQSRPIRQVGGKREVLRLEPTSHDNAFQDGRVAEKAEHERIGRPRIQRRRRPDLLDPPGAQYDQAI